jgi:hypothetical protein
MAGIKRTYSATGSGIGSNVRPIPSGIDDGPVAVVWMGSGTTEGGGHEHVVVDITLDIWVPGSNAAWAYKTIATFPDLARTAFRSDMDLSGQAVRCQFVGWDEPTTEEVNDRTYMILPVRLQLLMARYGSDAGSAGTGPAFSNAFSGDYN